MTGCVLYKLTTNLNPGRRKLLVTKAFLSIYQFIVPNHSSFYCTFNGFVSLLIHLFRYFILRLYLLNSMRTFLISVFILSSSAVGLCQNVYKKVVKNGVANIVLAEYNPAKLNYDYTNCQLTAKTGEWAKAGTQTLLPVTVTITNNADDTLRYSWDSDCWRRRFWVDNKNVAVEGADMPCVKNIPYTETILPHQSKNIDLRLLSKTDAVPLHEPCKVYLYLLLQRNKELEGLGIVEGLTRKNVMSKYERDVKSRTHIIASDKMEL